MLETEHIQDTLDFSTLNRDLSTASLETLLDWGLTTFGDDLVQVTSFGPTGMVILDHLARLKPGIRIVTIDTGFLFPETYQLWETVQRRYPIQLEVRQTRLTPQMQDQLYQPQLWQTNPDLCCHVRKVIPLNEVFHNVRAWLTGLRRDQSASRADLPLVQWDTKYEVVKINPLAGWTRKQVWAYIVEHKLPYNALHDQGYASIGCTHCTRPTTHGADERSGRWQGFQKTECGIHI